MTWCPSKSRQAAFSVISFLQFLGFQTYFRKSHPTLLRPFIWIGLKWVLSAYKVSLPLVQLEEIAFPVGNLMKQKTLTRPQKERVLGSLHFAALVDWVLKASLTDLTEFGSVEQTWRSGFGGGGPLLSFGRF